MQLTFEMLYSMLGTLKVNWTAGRTNLSGLSFEQKGTRLGLRVDSNQKTSFEQKKKALAMRMPYADGRPIRFDWRDKNNSNWMTSVKHQKGCGSCVAFACVGAMEPMIKISKNDPNLSIDLSEAFLFFCGGGDCDTGWYPDIALRYLQNHGVTDEGCFPYPNPAVQTPCANKCSDWQNRLTTIKGWQELLHPEQIKDWILEKGPIVAAMDVYEDFFYYVKGIYEHVSGDYIGGHCIVVSGYDDSQLCWICKNSWGTQDWSEDGWFKIKYDECGMLSRFPMWGIVV